MIPKQNAVWVNSSDITIYSLAKEYKQQVLDLIKQAQKRIYITVLYLQDDAAGNEVLQALFDAKQKNPQLDIKIFVDFHRAQRGLIGAKKQLGNRARYLALAQQCQHNIDIYGVAVKHKELFGVLHLKGMIFDDQVFYSGASINDVYCQQDERYRLDRYYQINSAALANSFCEYLNTVFVYSGFATLLTSGQLPDKSQQKLTLKLLKPLLRKTAYLVDKITSEQDDQHMISIKPFVGYGRRRNKLNQTVRQLVQNSRTEILMFTPYFNLPAVLSKDVIKALKRGVKVSVIVGDKTASDFYIPETAEFNTIGTVPYLYEILLRGFVKHWQHYIDNGLLNINLWKDGENSFHLKGLVVDKRYHLLTGSNLNPRAWTLDLENGILLDDIKQQLMPKVDQEVTTILQHTTKITHYTQLQSVNEYPDRPKKLLKKIRFAQIDRLLKRFL